MTLEPWMIAAVALFVLGHAVILLFVYRLRRDGASPLSSARAATAGTDGAGDVSCRECGAQNDGDYRFCRECVAELPGGVVPGGSGESPDSRGML